MTHLQLGTNKPSIRLLGSLRQGCHLCIMLIHQQTDCTSMEFFSHCSSSSALEVIMRKKPFHYCSVSSIQMWSLSQSWITRRDVHPICNSWRAWENPNNALSRYQASPKRLVPSFCYSLPVENLEWVFILSDSSFVFTEVDRSVSSTCSAVQACCLVLAPERFEESTVRKFRDKLRMEKCIRSVCTEVCFQSLF